MKAAASCAWPAIPPPRDIPLSVLPSHECVYLPPRPARMRAFMCNAVDPELYHDLMDAGFRRSGRLVYQPICTGCRECMPIRVPVDRFVPSKSQRRAWKRNRDVKVSIESPIPTQEKFDLYSRYVRDWHARPEEAEPGAFASFLYDSPVETIEITYRDASNKLLGVGICDVSSRSLSSVYFYFDPTEASRGLGTFSSLWEISLAREKTIAYYYLGYWVGGCATMRYKCTFRPHEILHPDGVWREI